MILVFANRKNVAAGFKWTAIVAAIALCVSAPIIIPFAEYFLNSDCYKIGHAATGTTPVAGILLNLLQPMYWGASPYLGCLCIAFVALALFVDGEKRATVLTLLAGCVVAFICICRPLFFAQLFDMTPASLVPGVYCTPVFLLQLAILSAFGADYFLEHLKAGKSKAFFVFAASLFIVCFLPAILNWCGFPFKIGSFDNGVKDMAFNSKTWLITIGLSLGISLLLILKNRTRIPALVVSLCIVALSLGSMAVDNRLSLPNQPAFNYDMIDPLPFLVEKGERVLALGFDVLCPNTNVAYRIASIGTHNVMQPARYIDFIVAAGARRTTFNTLIDKVPISRLVDYCGVKYVVSLGPVYGQGDPSAPKEAVQMPEAVVFSGRPEIKLVEAKVAYEARTAEASGTLKFEVEKGSEDRFVFTAVVLDGKGNPAWFGGLCAVQSAALQSGEVKLEALVPITFKANEKFYIGLHVFDVKELKILTPVISNANPHLKTFGPVLCLGGYQFAEPDKLARDIHYRLISESGPQRVRVYENTRSLGRAYIVFAGAFRLCSGPMA